MALRTKLDQLIVQLKNSVPQTVLADDALLESNWNNMCASIKLLTQAVETICSENPDVPLVGFSYVRLPGMEVPWEQYPRTTKSQWAAVHERYPGDFFRLAGGNASRFQASGTAISHDSGVGGTGGGQIDTIQSHTHGYEDYKASQHVAGTAGASSKTYTRYMYGEQRSAYTTKDDNARHSQETRPANVTVEWYVYNG